MPVDYKKKYKNLVEVLNSIEEVIYQDTDVDLNDRMEEVIKILKKLKKNE